MIYVLIFIFGLCIGSFLNVVICRLKTKESIFIGRSYCPKCRAVLKWYDLIPVLSFLIQKGKCRYCNKNISWQYPIIEITTACLFLLIFNFKFLIFKQFLIFNFINLIYFWFIVSILIIIFVYDLKHYIIPDKIVYPAIAISLLYSLFIIHNPLFNYLLSAFIASGFFLFLVFITKGKGMGLGDVKLAFLMGLILGWPSILLALFLSFFSGAVVGIGLIMLHKKGFKSQIPFGPFLSASTVFVLLYGSQLIEKFLTIDNLFK